MTDFIYADDVKQTGIGRKDILEYCREIILGIVKHMDENGLPALPFRDQAENYRYTCCPGEVFERSMIAAAFYAQAVGSDKINGINFVEKWRKGLNYITDPASSGYWDRLGDYSPIGSQIATAILLAREYFWDPLNDKEKENIARFLDKSARNDSHDNNHYLFHMIPLILVEELGIKSNRPEMEDMFERCLNWYRGNGWFIDGANKAYDWYNNHGFHLYMQMLYYFDEGFRSKYGQEIRKISKAYLKNYPLLFDKDGYALPQGRSLCYRFVNLSPIGWMIANDMWSPELGLARGMVDRTLKLFFDNNCIDKNGLLAPGYFAENKKLKETYLDYGAQYFACHGFSSLLLPEDHQYWQVEEKDISTGTAVLEHGAVLKKSLTRGARLYNINNAFNGDRWQRSIKYYQHSYSTQTGMFLVGDGNDEHPNQSGISIDGENWLYRTDPRKLKTSEKHCVSSWDIELENEYSCFMTTHHLLFEEGEVYIIYHNAAVPLFLRFSGIAALDNGDTYSVLEKLSGPEGNITLMPAGEDIYHNRPGTYPLWQSKNKIRPLVPVIFKVDAGLKGNQSQKKIFCRQKNNNFIITWGKEEIEVSLPGPVSRYK